MSNFLEVADQFVKLYYATFDQSKKAVLNPSASPDEVFKREELQSLFRENSMMSWESDQQLGVANIMNMIMKLKINEYTVQHHVVTQDAQPTMNGGSLVIVTGALQVGEDKVDETGAPEPAQRMNFSQVFHLVPDNNGAYYVHNCIFKLIL